MTLNIVLSDIKKSYDGRTLFDIPELVLKPGFNLLFGQSGIGKTTLGKIIGGLEKADCGRITGIQGSPAVLFQENLLLPTLNAVNNVYVVCRKKEFKTLGHNLLRELNFSDADMKKLPSELSGGMMRRVAIVRTIIFCLECGGNFVLLDEPFTALDSNTKLAAAEMIKKYLYDKTVLIITHDRDDAEIFEGTALEFSAVCNKQGKN